MIETGVEIRVGRTDKGGKVTLRVADRAGLGEEGVGADRVVPVINILGDGPGLHPSLLFLFDHLLKLCDVAAFTTPKSEDLSMKEEKEKARSHYWRQVLLFSLRTPS
jgi:hypothetical protein